MSVKSAVPVPPLDHHAMTASLLFDMDGVLVDTSRSYREAIVRTVRLHTTTLPDGLRRAWAHPDTVRQLKSASGFNNDWHLTEAIVCLAHAQDPMVADPARLADALKAAGALGPGLHGVRRLCGLPDGPLPDTDHMPPLVATFQAHYLGPALLQRLHPGVPYTGDGQPGAIDSEALLVSVEHLQEASRRFALGIATGRPAGEAAHALAQHRMEGFFQTVVSHDDVRAEERATRSGPLGKPSPWPLLEALRRLSCAAIDCLGYFGDLPDDMRAALGARVPGLGIASGESEEAALRAAGAMRTFATTDAAIAFVLADP